MTYLLLIVSVFAGAFIASIFKPEKKQSVKLLLSFSGAYLLAICVMHLLPEVYHRNEAGIGLYILAGFVFQVVLEFFSKGIEHGHGHLHKYKDGMVPLTAIVSLNLHALLEGMPLGAHEEPGHELLLMGVVLHKVPVSIVLFTMFRQLKVSTPRMIILLSLFAFMAPIGAGIVQFWESIVNYYDTIVAIVIGMFLHISTTILFESSEGHRFNLVKLVAIILGAAVAWLSSIG